MGTWPRWRIVVVAYCGVAAVAAIDLVTGRELSVSIFFLLPVGYTTWFAGRNPAFGVAFASATLWYSADRLGGTVYSHPLIPVWNAAVRLGFFLTVASLLVVLHGALKRQEHLARQDQLTGLANLRHFSDVADLEVHRARRYGHPISIAYLDVDDFKDVNDRFGHQRGDTLLRSIAATIQANIRSSDTLGRLGGDEFALLMPETSGEAAIAAVAKLQEALHEAMADSDLDVTVSVGCVTYSEAPPSVDQLIGGADSLMYQAKKAGKDTVTHDWR